MKKNDLVLLRDMIVILIAMISLSIFITINFTAFYHFFVIYDQLGRKVGMKNARLMSEYDSLIKYLQCGWVRHWHSNLPSSANGLKHFSDVKNLIQLNNFLLIMSSIISVRIIYLRLRCCQMWQLILPLKATVTLLITMIFILVAAFNSIFIAFHKILFRNRDWIFDPRTDPIIKALPESFFEGCFLMVVVLIILFGLILIKCGKTELKK